jgi:hypothetical protein
VATGAFSKNQAASWAGNSATAWEGLNQNANTRINVVRGLDLDVITAHLGVQCTAGSSANAQISIGLDTTTTPVGLIAQWNSTVGVTLTTQVQIPAAFGYHFVQALQRANSANSTMFGATDLAVLQGVFWQ